MTEDELSYAVIGAAIDVHKELGGPGLLEDIYEEALCHELSLLQIPVRRQVGVPVIYKGKELTKRLVLDLLVADKLIVEVKSVEQHHSLFEAQLLTYLRLTGKKLGLVINFGEELRQGWRPPCSQQSVTLCGVDTRIDERKGAKARRRKEEGREVVHARGSSRRGPTPFFPFFLLFASSRLCVKHTRLASMTGRRFRACYGLDTFLTEPGRL